MAETNVPVKEGPIGTYNDLLSQLQSEIEMVKNGNMSESQARVVLGFRKAELKVAELGLQYMRMVRPRTGGPSNTKAAIPILPGPLPEETPKSST